MTSSTLLGLDDTILELEVTPNRSDCMGMIGIAREVAAVYTTELIVPEAGLDGDDLDCPVTIDNQDPEGCPRYLARYLEEVKVVPSPAWMAARLLSAGFRPISNIVDATNYVLLETGQPLHAFDAAKIQDQKIVVRRAEANERLTTLDGVERTLDPRDLVIADPGRAVALAGVMGGQDSEVTDTTTAIILEAASFDKPSVAFTSRRHNLRSEASARFERGCDPDAPPYAAARAARFMKETGGGKVSRREPDAYPAVLERPRVHLRPSRTTLLLGLDIPSDRQVENLRRLKLPAEVMDGTIEVEVPSFRRDISIEEDLIEEVGRIEGLEKIAATVPPAHGGALTPDQQAERTLRRVLVAQGVTEAWTSSFLAPTDLDALGLGPDHPARRLVELENPMIEYETALRSTPASGAAPFDRPERCTSLSERRSVRDSSYIRTGGRARERRACPRRRDDRRSRSGFVAGPARPVGLLRGEGRPRGRLRDDPREGASLRACARRAVPSDERGPGLPRRVRGGRYRRAPSGGVRPVRRA